MRTALALAAVTGTEVELKNIRESRDPPGLAHQHLAVVNTLARICDAELNDVKVGSQELVFRPGNINGGRYNIDIGTAGSVPLLMQAVLPVAIHADRGVELRVVGGTDVKWSPTIDYFKNVTTPILEGIGVEAGVELVRRGYYPKGGGCVELNIEQRPLQPIDLKERGVLEGIHCVAHVSNLPVDIAEREAEEASKHLDLGIEPDISVKKRDVPSTGTAITVWANFSSTVMGGSGIGEKGKPAEEVGREAAKELLRSVDSNGVVDVYTGDQLVPYVALAGGSYLAPERTPHLETNTWVCNQFMDRGVCLEGSSPVEVTSPTH